MADLSVLKNIVRTGRVSSVNAGNRTARVTFEDKGQSPLVSGELKVIKNPPFIPAKGFSWSRHTKPWRAATFFSSSMVSWFLSQALLASE